MGALSVLKSVVLVIILLYSLSLNCCDGGRVASYYRVKLIRRESALSPLMKAHNLTKIQRVRLSLERSKRRLERLQALARGQDFNSPIGPGDSEFLMQMGIGSPSPVPQHMILDTGSDLIWVQCGPKCQICYPQEDPWYNPHTSSTYQNVSCNNIFCTRLDTKYCEYPNTCGYSYAYGDGSNTTGNMATEAFSLKRMGSASFGWEALPRLAFGCGHHQEGGPTLTVAGLVGLGRGVLSLVSQLGQKINHKFSYCLGPLDDDAGVSSLTLGDAHLPGNFQSTPLIRGNEPNYVPSLYYLDLHGISVGGTMIKYPASTFRSGGLIIDSGAMLTSLVDPAYTPFLAAVKSSIKAKPVNVPSTVISDLCYESSTVPISKLPRIAFHFAGNAKFIVPPRNSFLKHEDDEGREVLCLAYTTAGAEGETSILGNTQQVNYNIIYDLLKNKLSFAPAVCDNLY